MIDTNHKLSKRFFFINNDTVATPSANNSRMIPMSRLIALSVVSDTSFRILFDDAGVADQLLVKFSITSGKGREVMKDIVDAINSKQRVVTIADRSTGQSITSHYDKGLVSILAGGSGSFGVGGNLTVGNNATVNANLAVTGFATFNGGIKRFVELTSTASILAANSGIPHLIGPAAAGLAADSVFTLPTPAVGLYYKFIYVGGATDGHATTIDTGSSDNFYIGGMTHFDTDSGPNNAGTPILLYSNNSSNRKILMSIPGAGSYVEVFCDGTNWFASGAITSTSTDLSNALFQD